MLRVIKIETMNWKDTPSENELIKFIQKKNLFVSQKGLGQKANFLNLTGGSWFIPDNSLDEFYKIIRKMCLMKIPISIVEVRTDIFHYFIDVDLTSPLSIEMSSLKKIGVCIYNCIVGNITFSGNQIVPMMYAYGAEPREIFKENKRLIKTGMHLYYPDILVDSSQALELRKRMIVELLKIDNEIDWQSAIDESVYKGSGLRLAHMPKLRKCKCEKFNNECKFGCNGGILNENAIYAPIFSVTSGQIQDVEKLKNNLRHSFALTKIRSNLNEEQPNIMLKATNETIELDDFIKRDHQKSKRSTRISNNFYISDTEILSKEIQRKIDAFIKKSYEEYKHIVINYVKKLSYKANGRNDVYTKYIVNTNCKFCLNIKGNHNSNHIYFLIFITGTKMQLTQRCHCTCNTPHSGTNILCKTYSSKNVEIPPQTELYKSLMPPVTNKFLLNESYENTVASNLNIDITDDETNKTMLFHRLNKIRKSTCSQIDEECSKIGNVIGNPSQATSNRLKMVRGKI